MSPSVASDQRRASPWTRRPALPLAAHLACWVVLSANAAGDIARGAALVASRSQGLCTLCHAVPGLPRALRATL